LSQHQQAFLVEDQDSTSSIERLVLSVLSGGKTYDASAFDFGTFEDQLFKTSISEDKKDYRQAVDQFQTSIHDVEFLAGVTIPNVARRLGKAWEMDEITFADVTIGCARLQSTLRDLPPRAPFPSILSSRSCLVFLHTGFQHSLGACVLTRQLRNAGMDVMLKLDADQNTLSELVQTHNFDIVLISASVADCPATVGEMVQLSRAYWPTCKTVVGGSICDLGIDITTKVGADLVTKDIQKVVNLCN